MNEDEHFRFYFLVAVVATLFLLVAEPRFQLVPLFLALEVVLLSLF